MFVTIIGLMIFSVLSLHLLFQTLNNHFSVVLWSSTTQTLDAIIVRWQPWSKETAENWNALLDETGYFLPFMS